MIATPVWDAVTMAEVIDDHPEQAALAWAAMIVGRENDLPNQDGIKVAAAVMKKPLSQYWAEYLAGQNLLEDFALALLGQGVVAAAGGKITIEDLTFPEEPTQAFISRARAFRCQVFVNQQPKGSGFLVGPTSVLTAWHVIAGAAPDDPPAPPGQIEVELADGRRLEAGLPTLFETPCSGREYNQKLPENDAEVDGRDDLALLPLKESVGIRLGFAPLPDQAAPWKGPGAIVLIAFPEGKYSGLAFGKLSRIKGLTARWGHDAVSAGGSSGGGCFDTSLTLAGVHQGRASPSRGRMVPFNRFPQDLLRRIADDAVPNVLWSLDGTANTPLVIGRDSFFTAYAAASRPASRVRGLWIKRADALRDQSGLPFSYEMLDKMTARSPATRVVRIGFDGLVDDLPGEVARRVSEAGFPVAAPDPRDGAGAGQTEPEAVVADRARRLVMAMDEVARNAGARLWLFLDHPVVLFGEEARWAMGALIDQALRADNLRLVIAGYEAVQMPGAQFQNRFEADSAPGPPGLMMEYLTGFSRPDVKLLIERAIDGLRAAASPERIDELADEALDGLLEVGGLYRPWMGAEVSRRLQPRLLALPPGPPSQSPLTGAGS
ncbi:trypsin-like peptidase domain-containing protein [Caulobacter sp. NIBR1757]|uniref:trypsin-like peptidase domain-containing protein n=1 Tax=Caulobacter sp. NIBR1757 TaxID=3016000 RepID=UPI0022F0C60B|nr:trypsin-like peptidase domain-containing protein [Caulobacter sp. NIBR1757]WGM37670.1 hypothetical protein AMEJIAPC_00569 [Caulobacter sp. NIBR1757]